MKKILSMLTLLSFFNITYAQHISYKEKLDIQLYSTVFSQQKFKEKPIDLPYHVMINGSYLSYYKEFITEEFTLKSLKNFMLNDEWMFVQQIDTGKYLRRSEQLNIGKLKVLKHQGFKFYKDLSYTYNLSPIVYDEDYKKAVIILQRSMNGQVLEVMVYFLNKDNEKWQIIKAQSPYTI